MILQNLKITCINWVIASIISIGIGRLLFYFLTLKDQVRFWKFDQNSLESSFVVMFLRNSSEIGIAMSFLGKKLLFKSNLYLMKYMHANMQRKMQALKK